MTLSTPLPAPIGDDWKSWAQNLISILESELGTSVSELGGTALNQTYYDQFGRIILSPAGVYAYGSSDPGASPVIDPGDINIDTQHLVDGAITTDKLDSGAVTTDKIAANAVTEQYTNYTAAAATTGTLATVTFTADGSNVALNFTCLLDAFAGTGTETFELRNGATVLQTYSIVAPAASPDNPVAFSFLDTPTAGSVTYSVVSTAGSLNKTERSLVVVQFKK